MPEFESSPIQPEPEELETETVLLLPTDEVTAEAAGPWRDDESEKSARQLAEIVEKDRRQHRRVLTLYLSLLAVPVLLGVAAVALGDDVQPFSNNQLETQVRPIVQQQFETQFRPVVEEKLGEQIDTVITARVNDKVPSAAKFQELSASVNRVSSGLSEVQAGLKEIETIKSDLTAVRAGLGDVQTLKADLPQLRTQLTAQSASIEKLQGNVARIMDDPNGNKALVTRLAALQKQLADLESKLDNSVKDLSSKVNKNSEALKVLTVRIGGDKPGGRDRKLQE